VIEVYEVSRKNTMLSMHNNGYLSLGGLLIDSSHIPKLLKTSDIVYIFQAKYYTIFYNTENNTKI